MRIWMAALQVAGVAVTIGGVVALATTPGVGVVCGGVACFAVAWLVDNSTEDSP